MKGSSKSILYSIALLLGSADGELSNENKGWSSIEAYLSAGASDSISIATPHDQKYHRRAREENQMTFEEFIGRRVLKSSKRSSSSSSSLVSTKSSKRSKPSYRRPVQKIATARPTPSPTPPPTPPPTIVDDDDDDDDDDDGDDDAVGDSVLTFAPGELRYPLVEEEGGTQYGIGVHTKSPSEASDQTATSFPIAQPTLPPTHHPLLKPLERIDALTSLVFPDDESAQLATIAPTQRPTESPSISSDEDSTLSPTVYLFRDRNHHAAFQTQGLSFDKNPWEANTMAMGDNSLDSGNDISSDAGLSVLVLLGDETSDDPAKSASNMEIADESSHSNCRSSLCSARTKSNQNHYCCDAAKCQQEDVIYPLPSFRFGDWKTTVYTNLTMLYFADVFGYTEATWEMPGTNPIEKVSFLDVSDQELLVYMGISSFQYDCWINHYQSYSWDELDCYGLADAYATLGWDADSWGTIIHSTTWSLKEEKEWSDLTGAEQNAARMLCYFPELWNGKPLSEWNEGWLDGTYGDVRAYGNHTETEVVAGETVPPTTISSDQPTLSPSQSASSSDPDVPSSVPTTTQTESMAPSNSDSDMPSALPTEIASVSPSGLASEGPSAASTFPTESSISSDGSCLSSACSIRTPENVGDFCCGTDDTYCDRKTIVLPIPTFRWHTWDALDDPLRRSARELGYTKDLWNHPGAYELEHWSFGFLSTPNQAKIIDLGFTPQTWDCWQNHYQDYSWEELSCFGLGWAAEALGWDGASWSNGLLLNRKDWAALSYHERSAARELCYLPTLWEFSPLDEWND